MLAPAVKHSLPDPMRSLVITRVNLSAVARWPPPPVIQPPQARSLRQVINLDLIRLPVNSSPTESWVEAFLWPISAVVTDSIEIEGVVKVLEGRKLSFFTILPLGSPLKSK